MGQYKNKGKNKGPGCRQTANGKRFWRKNLQSTGETASGALLSHHRACDKKAVRKQFAAGRFLDTVILYS
jgi:hypothetical protein